MKDQTEHIVSRRNFLLQGGTLLGAAALLSSVGLPGCGGKEDQAEVTATEALQRDHGVLQRALLLLDEMGIRLKSDRDFPLPVLTASLDLIRRFVLEYHEKLEEEHLFPRFEQAGKHLALVKILKEQHAAGRQVMDFLKAQANPPAMRKLVHRVQAAAYMRLFTRLYRPHAAQEDTVLFPAVRAVVAPKELAALGKKFRDADAARFGADGFEKIVEEMAALEKELGIADFSQFTPKI